MIGNQDDGLPDAGLPDAGLPDAGLHAWHWLLLFQK